MSWLKEVIGTEKAVIAMCHLRALPGDPSFDAQLGMNWVIDKARDDLMALQNGGVDAVMFSNEFSLPYLTKVRPETTAAMARIIGQLMSDIRIPFGVNVLWDRSPHSAAMATALSLSARYLPVPMPATLASGTLTSVDHPSSTPDWCRRSENLVQYRPRGRRVSGQSRYLFYC